MADEQGYNKDHIVPKSIRKKKEHIRVFIRRKRLAPGILHKSIPSQSNRLKQLTSIIEKRLNKNTKNSGNNKNIVLVNYKPVFIRSRQQKSTETNNNSTSSSRNNQQCSMTTIPTSDNPAVHSKINSTSNQQSVPSDALDVEDPLMFIEMMYQQLFTENGELRSGTEPEVLANCVKQIVTQSRRNSMAHRDSIASNTYPRKYSTTSVYHPIPSLSSSSRFISNSFTEEEEPNTSRRNSKRSSIDHVEHHQQRLHEFLNSYYQRQGRSSTYQTTIKPDNHFSVDDTDNEDLDTFSDLNSYRKTIRTSPPASIDEDTIHIDSKHLLSSGYQSLKSRQPIISKTHSENDHHYCSNCFYTPQIYVTPSTSSINIFQSIREIFTKYLNFILISKNILFVPLFIFLLRQRSMNTSN